MVLVYLCSILTLYMYYRKCNTYFIFRAFDETFSFASSHKIFARPPIIFEKMSETNNLPALYDEGFALIKSAKEAESKSLFDQACILYFDAIDTFTLAIYLEPNSKRFVFALPKFHRSLMHKLVVSSLSRKFEKCVKRCKF